jgi:MFS transporter, UMF1 family
VLRFGGLPGYVVGSTIRTGRPMPTVRRASAHDDPADARPGDALGHGSAGSGEAAGSVSRLSIGSWAVYDVSNTLFFTGIMGTLFPLWVANSQGGNDATVGFIVACAMVINLMVAPVIGTMSDNARRRLPFLGIFSMIGIATTFLLGAGSPETTVLLFIAAVVTMHVGTVIYNALLVEVSDEGNRGFIGSIGAGIGYLGALLAVGVGIYVGDDYVTGFRVIGVLMLVMTLPVLILLRERPRELRAETHTPSDRVGKGFQAAFTDLAETIRHTELYPGLRSLLIGRFWYYLAVNTAALFAFRYGTVTIGFSEYKVWWVLAVGIAAAMVSAPLWGMLVDRLGSFRSMQIVLAAWFFVLLGTVAIPWLGLPNDLYWAIGAFSGIMVAGTWVTDRPLLLKIIPAEHAGQFFGLHSLTGRLGTIIGPVMWGFIAADKLWFGQGPSIGLGMGQTYSVVGLIFATILALYFVSRSGDEFGAGLASNSGTGVTGQSPG